MFDHSGACLNEQYTTGFLFRDSTQAMTHAALAIGLSPSAAVRQLNHELNLCRL